jgi:hypothetical protein
MTKKAAKRTRFGNRVTSARGPRVERWNFILTLPTISAMTGGIMVMAFALN